MSIDKASDDGNVSIFTNNRVSVCKQKDVLVTCKGKAIPIDKRDERDRYQIPLMQT